MLLPPAGIDAYPAFNLTFYGLEAEDGEYVAQLFASDNQEFYELS